MDASRSVQWARAWLFATAALAAACGTTGPETVVDPHKPPVGSTDPGLATATPCPRMRAFKIEPSTALYGDDMTLTWEGDGGSVALMVKGGTVFASGRPASASETLRQGQTGYPGAAGLITYRAQNSDVGGPLDASITLNAPVCGNGSCERGENQNNCCADCGCPRGQQCSGGACKAADCTPGQACNDGNACTHDDICGADRVCAGTAYTCTGTCQTCDGAGGCTMKTNCCGNGIAESGETKDNCCGDVSCPAGQVCENGPRAACVVSTCPGGCDDSNACTTDSCNAGVCQHTPVDCNDSNICTTDSCNTSSGCVHTPASCDDSNACTADSCSTSTGCVHTPISCDDSDVCTTDSCNAATGCKHTPISCDDSNACTDDSCNATTGCKHTARNCDDRDACTDDSCDSRTGCEHTPKDCDDHNACTVDSCSAGTCKNTPKDCDDHNACTVDSCSAGTCQNDPLCSSGYACDNGTCLQICGGPSAPLGTCGGSTTCANHCGNCYCLQSCPSPCTPVSMGCDACP